MSRPDYLEQIENRIILVNDGDVFITSDFLDIADTQTVNKALSRLTEGKKTPHFARRIRQSPI